MRIRSVGVAEGGQGRSVGVAVGEREERRIKHASAGTLLYPLVCTWGMCTRG